MNRSVKPYLMLFFAALFLFLLMGTGNADGEITTWAELQTAINAGGTVTLTQSITATSGDSALTVPKNVTVTLDLNGYTLSRGLTTPVSNGGVIVVKGTLVVTGEGTITGGNTTGQGGGVYINGGGKFTMNGGTITGNTSAGNGAGVFVVSSATFTVNGNATVSGNTYANDDDGSNTQNVYLGSSAYIRVGDSFTGSVGVWTKEATYIRVTNTYGCMDESSLSHFSSDRHKEYEGRPYGLGILDGEVYFGPLFDVTVTSDSLNGTVTVNRQKVMLGGNVTLTFEPADKLSALSINGNNIELSNIVNGVYTCEDVQADVAIHVTFVHFSWADLQDALNDGGTVSLTQDYTAASGDSALTVPSGTTVTLDLNGYTLNRGMANSGAVENGYVILNEGILTITDSGSGGKITGGNNSGNGGGIYNTGTLTLTGGSITGNRATGEAGGVYNGGTMNLSSGSITRNTAGLSGGGIFNAETLTITGGSITSNTATGWHGGGVYNGGTMNLSGGSITGNTAQGGQGSGQGGGILNNGTLNVSGAPVVSGNTGPNGNNIYMRNAHPTMTVNGALTTGASLYVTSARGTDTITSGYGTYNGSAYPVYYFHADSADCGVALTSSGEAEIITLLQITVETAAHGSLSADKAKASPGETVTLTAEPDEGYWLSSVKLYDTGNQLIREVSTAALGFIMPDQTVVVRAEFKVKKTVSTDVLYPFAGLTLHGHGTLTADKATAEGGETVTLTLTTEEGYGLKTGGMTAYSYLNGVQQTAIAVTEQPDGTWTFVMPDGDYTATAYAEIEWQNAPPSGTRMPYFYIDSECTAHGTVSAGSVPVLTPPVSPSNLYQPTVTQITMSATPEEGYVLKGWEAAAVNSSGEPLSQGYSLPAEREGSIYIISFNKVNNNYIFRIRAIFEEAPQLIAVNVATTNKTGTLNTGSTMSASPTAAYSGKEITLTANLAEGAKLSSLQIFYTPREENALGTYTNYIEPTQDGNTFTFTVPQGISPNDAKIYVIASFEDDSYGITVPANQDEKIGTVTADKTTAAKGETVTLTAAVAGNVTFNPVNDLSVSYTDGNHQTHTVPITLTDTVDLTSRVYYTYTFTMPAYPVDISANYAQKTYSITRADVTSITPAANRPETTITVAGFDVSTDHVYARANEGDTVWLSVTAPNSADNTKQAVRGIYYTLDDDPEGTHHDLTLTLDEFQNPSASFAMPAGNITLHYVIETAYAVLFDTNEVYGTASADKRYAFEGETVTVAGTPDNSVYAHDRLSITELYGSERLEWVVYDSVNGVYTTTFTMPDAQVVVRPEFRMEPVAYTEYSWTGSALSSEEKIFHRYFPLAQASGDVVLTSGDYVVSQDTTFNGYLSVAKGSTVNLVVQSGATLTFAKGLGCGYNGNGQYAALNLFGDGKIVATGKEKAAGIGGGNDESNGNIAIHGVTVSATGGKFAAGIGCGNNGRNTDATSIVIYGGTITATGGEKGAGIGGGDDDTGTPIYIHGGSITANGGSDSAGIGGGRDSGTRGVYITGGTVNATGRSAAGIGAGYKGGNIRTIHISGGNVTAVGGGGAAGIGGSRSANMKGTIKITGASTRVNAISGDDGAGIGAGGYSSLAFSGGDMRGEIIIDCGADSRIDVTSLMHGAGIGAGSGGNMTGSVTINGGNVYIHAGLFEGGGAGIGGGQESGKIGGEGGDVYINGGHVEIWGVGDDAECIGNGDNDRKSGDLKLAEHLRVTLDGVSVKRSERTDTCHSRNKNKRLVIEACQHSDCTHTITATGHTPVCDWCFSEFQESEHVFGADPACSVCGYQSGMVAVHFAPGLEGVAGGMPDMLVMPGGALTLPVCGFTVPEGKCFGGWMRAGDDRVYAPDEAYTVPEELTLTAQWLNLYTVTFVYDETGASSPYEDDAMQPVILADGSVFILPECGFTNPSGMRFKTWMVKIGGADAFTPLNEEAEITVTANVLVAAGWSAEIDLLFMPGYEGAPEGSIVMPVAYEKALSLPECMFTPPDGYEFDAWEVDTGDGSTMTLNPGNSLTVTAEFTVTAVWKLLPSFGNPDFVIPAGVTAIEDNAFEGVAATIVEIPANCTSIGSYAFKNCAYLTQIRIPADCALGTDVFDGCEKVYVFSAAGSPAEAYCSAPGHGNCVFIAEAQSGTGE